MQIVLFQSPVILLSHSKFSVFYYSLKKSFFKKKKKKVLSPSSPEPSIKFNRSHLCCLWTFPTSESNIYSPAFFFFFEITCIYRQQILFSGPEMPKLLPRNFLCLVFQVTKQPFSPANFKMWHANGVKISSCFHFSFYPLKNKSPVYVVLAHV